MLCLACWHPCMHKPEDVQLQVACWTLRCRWSPGHADFQFAAAARCWAVMLAGSGVTARGSCAQAPLCACRLSWGLQAAFGGSCWDTVVILGILKCLLVWEIRGFLFYGGNSYFSAIFSHLGSSEDSTEAMWAPSVCELGSWMLVEFFVWGFSVCDCLHGCFYLCCTCLLLSCFKNFIIL